MVDCIFIRSKFLNINEANAPLVDDTSHGRNLAVSEFPGRGNFQQWQSASMQTGEVNFLQSCYDLKLPKKKTDLKKTMRGPSTGTSKAKSTMAASSISTKRGVSKGKSMSKRKKDVSTTFDEKNPYHMAEKIDLSNFRGKNFSRAGFREFLEGIEDMRCLTTVILKNNGINDDFVEELGLN